MATSLGYPAQARPLAFTLCDTKSRRYLLPWETMMQPDVLPSVPYPHMRRRQRRGMKLLGKSSLARKAVIESREEMATAGIEAVGSEGASDKVNICEPLQASRGEAG